MNSELNGQLIEMVPSSDKVMIPVDGMMGDAVVGEASLNEVPVEDTPCDEVAETPIFPIVTPPSFLKRIGNWLSR